MQINYQAKHSYREPAGKLLWIHVRSIGKRTISELHHYAPCTWGPWFREPWGNVWTHVLLMGIRVSGFFFFFQLLLVAEVANCPKIKWESKHKGPHVSLNFLSQHFLPHLPNKSAQFWFGFLPLPMFLKLKSSILLTRPYPSPLGCFLL